MAILIPFDMFLSEIDQLFLSEIDNFGSISGEYAHTSPSNHTTKKPDPKDEYKKVSGILDLIKPVDRALDALLSLTRAK